MRRIGQKMADPVAILQGSDAIHEVGGMTGPIINRCFTFILAQERRGIGRRVFREKGQHRIFHGQQSLADRKADRRGGEALGE